MYWDGREGGWQGHPVLDHWDLIGDIGLELQNETLLNDICHAFLGEEFADEDYWPGPYHERQMSSWERFKQIVKHERRYTFGKIDNDKKIALAEIQPTDMLNAIGGAIDSTTYSMTLKPGKKFWRVRIHDPGRLLEKAEDLSTPPREFAIYSNRMSPSGIPMFYGADDFDTAIAETVDLRSSYGKQVSGGVFHNLVSLNVLDLTAIPLPKDVGFFNDWTRDTREAVKFLRAFTHDITQPVSKDGSEHTDYVPTQVFTEFIRYEVKTPANEPYHGIRFPSSKTGRGCYVLFVEQDECLPSHASSPTTQLLRFDDGSFRRVDAPFKTASGT